MTKRLNSYCDIFANKKSILFVTAHPDDVDVFFGGLIAKLADDDKEVAVVAVTLGAKGSKDKEISEELLAKKRSTEQTNSLNALGLSKESFSSLHYVDGMVENDMKLIGDIAKVIRRNKPDIVCTHEPNGYYYSLDDMGGHYVNHRDHRNVGSSVLDAVYPFSRDRSFFPEHYEDDIEPFSVFELLFTGDFRVNTEIDYTDLLENKRKALTSHESQFSADVVEEILASDKAEDKYVEKFNHLKLLW
ncbi:MAG: PIG-L deacetylase family protein [Candidatus Dojkabacteria bacterium]